MMIIDEASTTLTCVKGLDGFQYELLLKAAPDQPAVTKIRIGPYLFKPEHQPRLALFGFHVGDPEGDYWMNTWILGWKTSTPANWSFWKWEVDEVDGHRAWYLVTRGVLNPGKQALLKYCSNFGPGGLRAGLEIYRGEQHVDLGVTGPNYEHFLEE